MKLNKIIKKIYSISIQFSIYFIFISISSLFRLTKCNFIFRFFLIKISFLHAHHHSWHHGICIPRAIRLIKWPQVFYTQSIG